MGETARKVKFRQDTEEFFQLYALGERIGLGGFATVLKGVDKRSGEPVAVKVLDKSRYLSDDNSLEREVYILSELAHENIVRLICTYVCPLQVLIVTELAAGGELLERLSTSGSFSEVDARNIVIQILRAIEYLHSRNIVHRDLKLENILLSDDVPPVVKVADFGLSRFFTDGSELKTICGSPLYVAPEILDIGTCIDTYTPAVDMWSVGVILYILLSGYSPFDSDDEQAMYQKIKRGEYSMKDDIWQYISEGAKSCIFGLLMVDNRSRMTVAEALHHPWILGLTNTEMQIPEHCMQDKRNRYLNHYESFRMSRDEEDIVHGYARMH